MTEQQEKAMRMALEALKKSHPISNSNEDLYAHSEAGSELYNELKKAKALAQPEQEPVAWENGAEWEALAWHLCAEEYGEEACADLLYDNGPIPMPWGERWLKYEEEAKRTIELVRRYTTPPKREWVDLTDDDEEQCLIEADASYRAHCALNEQMISPADDYDWHLIQAVLAKAKEKNI
jgi:hypothetical protein